MEEKKNSKNDLMMAKPQIKKVVKNPAKIKKKSKLATFAESFFIEDIKSVFSWAATDVAVPALKKLFVEFIDNTANSMVYGKGSVNYRDRRRPVGDNISYRAYWDDRPRRSDVYEDPHNDVYSYGTITVDTRDEANDTLNQMQDVIDRYGMVLVSHVLEMVKIPPRSTDSNYGWTSIRGAKYVRTMDGRWKIILPKVMPID